MNMLLLLSETLKARSVDVVPTKIGYRPDSKYTHAYDLCIGVIADESGFYIAHMNGGPASYYRTADYDLGVEAAAKDAVESLRSKLGLAWV